MSSRLGRHTTHTHIPSPINLQGESEVPIYGSYMGHMRPMEKSHAAQRCRSRTCSRNFFIIIIWKSVFCIQNFCTFATEKTNINRLMEYAFPAYFESKSESALFCGRPNCCDANVCGGRLYSLMRHGRHSNPSGSGAFFMPFFGLFRRPTTPPQPPRECPKSVALQTFARFRDDIGKPSSPSFTSFPYRLEHTVGTHPP